MTTEEKIRELNEHASKLGLKAVVTFYEDKPYKRWRAEKGDRYWLVGDCGSVDFRYDDCYDTDNYRYNSGNYFQTEQQAEKHRDRQLLDQELRDFAEGYEFREGMCNFVIYYSVTEKKMDFYEVSTVRYLNGIYFPSEEKAQQAIEHFGDRLKLLL